MSTEPESQSEHNEPAELPEGVKQFLAKKNEELKRLDEEIHEAEKKSKCVIPDPEP